MHSHIPDPHHWLSFVPQTLERLSPLYAQLYQHLEQDPEIFMLLSLIDPDQPIPVLFFSVVTFLVWGTPDHPFARFYPVLTSTPKKPEEAYPAFRDFCLAHLEELQALLPTSRLQTNEVGRCAQLLPAFELVSRRGGRQPLTLIEIGASAGLNLNWYRYGYHYGSISTGDQRSPVQVQCKLSGDSLPPLPDTLPAIAQCLGIELFPLDITREHDVRWLRSCIWPEERTRYVVLDTAIAMAKQDVPRVLIGDACEILPDLLPTLPPDQTICVFHSFALHQGPTKVKERIIQTLCDASVERPIFRISLEAATLKQSGPRLELFTYRNGDLCHYEWLAECSFHGESMQWLADPTLASAPRV